MERLALGAVTMARIDLKLEALDKLIKACKERPPTIRIGILGGSDSRETQVQQKDGSFKTDVSSNATIGAAHEFGTSRLPMRSFLRMPLMDKLGKELDKQSEAFGKQALKDVIASGKWTLLFNRIAKLGVAVILDAFASNGFGKWAPWKTKGYSNNTGNILVDSQQLRNSITSDVKP